MSPLKPYSSYVVLALNAVTGIALLFVNRRAFQLASAASEVSCLSMFILDGMSYVWFGIYAMELLFVFTPALWGTSFAPSWVTACIIIFWHGFAISTVVLVRTNLSLAFPDETCMSTAYIPTIGRSARAPLAFQAIRFGCMPAVAALWKYALLRETSTVEAIAVPMMRSMQLVLQKSTSDIQGALNNMLPRLLLQAWEFPAAKQSLSRSTRSAVGQTFGQAEANVTRENPVEFATRRGVSIRTGMVALLAVHTNHSKDLLSLIGPVALFRVTREVCAAVEGACVRRMGRRVRISQEGVLAVFGLDKWGEADPTAQ